MIGPVWRSGGKWDLRWAPREHDTAGREGTRRAGATPTDPRDSRRVTEVRRDAAGHAAPLSPLRKERLPQARHTLTALRRPYIGSNASF